MATFKETLESLRNECTAEDIRAVAAKTDVTTQSVRNLLTTSKEKWGELSSKEKEIYDSITYVIKARKKLEKKQEMLAIKRAEKALEV